MRKPWTTTDGGTGLVSYRGISGLYNQSSVDGTSNSQAFFSETKGRTTLWNCAREPEVEELARVLNKMGAKVDGAGTDVIHVEGVDQLSPFDHAIIPDRIEAGTYMIAAAAVPDSDVRVDGAILEDLEALVLKMRQAGISIERDGSAIRDFVASLPR